MRAREPGDYRHGPERGGSPPGIPGFVGAADRSAGCGRRDGRRLHGPHGGPPEAFAGNEDTIFDLAVERLRPRKGFVPDAVVRWRPADSVRMVYRQHRKYAVGDGQAAIFLFRGTRYAALFATYGIAVLLLIAGMFWWPLWILLFGGASLYVGFRVRKVARAGLWSLVPYAILVVIAWDLSRMVGYTAGRIDRLIKGSAHFRF